MKMKKGLKITLIIIVVLVLIGILAGGGEENRASESGQIEGKHAYNKTNGVYQGVIVRIKDCKTASDIKCYEVDQGEGYSRYTEHPVDNVVVKDIPPSEKENMAEEKGSAVQTEEKDAETEPRNEKENQQTSEVEEISTKDKLYQLGKEVSACVVSVFDVNEDGNYEVICNAEDPDIEVLDAINAKYIAHDFIFKIYGSDLPVEFAGATITNYKGKTMRVGVGSEQAKFEKSAWKNPDELGPSIFIDWVKTVQTGAPDYGDDNWHDNTYYEKTF